MSWVCAFDLETIPCTTSVGRLHGVADCDDDKAADLSAPSSPSSPCTASPASVRSWPSGSRTTGRCARWALPTSGTAQRPN